MIERENIFPDGLPKRIVKGHVLYSPVVTVVPGKLVFVSGILARDSKGEIVGKGDMAAQIRQVFDNIKTALAAAGATMADIVKLNTYLVAEVSQDDLPKMRAIRDRYLNKEKPPASTLVVVSRLARPGWLIEIEAIAAID